MFNSVEVDNHRGLKLPLFEGEEDVLHLFGFRGPDALSSLGRLWEAGDKPVISCVQTHGDQVLVINSPELPQKPSGYDALITDQAGIILTVRSADCVPILIWDRQKKAAGAVHAGWRGSLLEITKRTVERMGREFGSSPGDLIAGIGPAAGPCCYEVDAAVLDPLREKFAYWEDVVTGVKSGRGKLDLVELNRRQLREAGLPSGQIQSAGACTICHKEKFLSFRRDGTAGLGMFTAIMKKT